jgi:C-terminal processing protease CtpA/Prc
MSLRSGNRATVIGSQTAGADGNVSRFSLPGGLTTAFSGIGVYYPDGKETQRVGIVPDIEVKPTIKGIQEGRDELLERAISVLENGE